MYFEPRNATVSSSLLYRVLARRGGTKGVASRARLRSADAALRAPRPRASLFVAWASSETAFPDEACIMGLSCSRLFLEAEPYRGVF